MKAKRPAKPPAPNWQSAGSAELLGPADQVAHEIVSARRDLFPSVERIMSAGLGADGTLRALGLFRESLSDPYDANRDPRVAIASCMADEPSPERR